MELKGSPSQKVQWVIIFLAHILLLYWIFYVLTHSGTMSMLEAVIHFSGVALYGAILIFISAALGRRNYRLEQEND